MLDLEDDSGRRRGGERATWRSPLATSSPSTSPCSTCRCRALDGIAVAEQLAAQLPGCGCVIVTSHGRPGHLKRALAAGVRGFLPKTTSAATLA